MNAREKKTVSRMILLYCRARHGKKEVLCPDCSQLEMYAHARLEHCRFGEKKPTCKYCPIHCYQPDMRRQIQEVMRFAGPRMLWHHPAETLQHLWKILYSTISQNRTKKIRPL